jgi:hypothetical protein
MVSFLFTVALLLTFNANIILMKHPIASNENEISGFTIKMVTAPIAARHPYRTKLVGVSYVGTFEDDSVLLSGSLSVRSGGRPVEKTPQNYGAFLIPEGVTREEYAGMVHEQVKDGLVDSNFPVHAVNRGIQLRMMRAQE